MLNPRQFQAVAPTMQPLNKQPQHAALSPDQAARMEDTFGTGPKYARLKTLGGGSDATPAFTVAVPQRSRGSRSWDR